ncbi:Sterol uptake control protein 2 [Colletotrichum sidae]|uniref:Sterol uptake control protein 2 n=1 Tax=Colletotrichum sidae TaxID=1347389 RepID=A0A4R8T2H9_9PEZI|nr:Sterol uptake control protein 2 [Colletotrichum sidae]
MDEDGDEHIDDKHDAADPKHKSSGCCCGTCRKNKRRSHKKSRNGCQNCKRRKVKARHPLLCSPSHALSPSSTDAPELLLYTPEADQVEQCDEVKPECGNCARFSMHCDFAPPPASLPAQSPTATSPPIPMPKKRGRPRKNWDSIPTPAPTASEPDSARTPHTPATTVIATSEPSPPVLPTLNANDLELLHHYMLHTSITLGDARVWREYVPRLGFQHNYVLHMVLAISAQHLARLRPDRAAHYEDLAEHHSTSALPDVTDMIPRLNKDNCQALYHTTVLVCLSTFAKKPSPGHLLVVAEEGEVPWWALLKGVRFVVETLGIRSIMAGWADDGVSFEQTWTHCPPLPVPVHKTVRWEARFRELEDLVATAPAPDRALYRSMFDILRDCFQTTFGTAAEPEEHVQGRFEVVMRWLYCMNDDFVDRLKRNHVLPLILLGHFDVVVQTLEHFWFMQGWSEHLMTGLLQVVEPQYAHWLEWPAEQIRRPASADGGVLSVQNMID